MLTPKPQRLFVSYSHKDESQKEEFVTCIRALSPKIKDTLEVWNDRQLKPGDDFDEVIFKKIKQTDIFFALVSRHYLASDYCQKEMYEALQKRGCRVVPVIVRKTPSWTDFPLGQNNAIPVDAKAPTDFADEDDYWAAVQTGLMQLVPKEPKQIGSGSVSGADPDIEVVAFDCHSEQEFDECVREQIVDALRQPLLRRPVGLLNGGNEETTDDVESAAECLVGLAPIMAIDQWTSVVRDALRSVAEDNRRERKAFWGACERVHHALLPRLVSHDWLADWLAASTSSLQFSLAFRDKPPNRSIEVLLCRLDAKRRACFLTADPKSARASAVPLGVVHADDEALRYAAVPDPSVAAEVLAKRLYVLDHQEPPTQMTADDWEDLNSLLVRGRAGTNSLSIVIPVDNPLFGNLAVLAALQHYLPNLPRLIVGDKSAGNQPFNCKPSDIEQAILTFYRLEPRDE